MLAALWKSLVLLVHQVHIQKQEEGRITISSKSAMSPLDFHHIEERLFGSIWASCGWLSTEPTGIVEADRQRVINPQMVSVT
jgi:hypothetical protein